MSWARSKAFALSLLIAAVVVVGMLTLAHPRRNGEFACVRPSLGPSWLWGCPP
jgi:hypothetical protein